MDEHNQALRENVRWVAALIVAALLAGSVRGETPQAPGAALKSGDSGAAVEALQRALNARLDPPPGLAVDGDFGPSTREAVVRFQRSKGLEPTGVVDRATWDALGAVPTAAKAPAPDVVNAEAPKKKPPDPLDGPPYVSAKAWAVVDGRTGALVGGRDEAKPLDMASTTKVMTALVVLRQAKASPGLLDETVTFSERADQTPGSTSGVRAGERVPLRELLYGLLLPSGNDASVALGEHVGRGIASEKADPLDRFVGEMNRVAGELGLRETHFANTHGLTAPGHQASARDLAALARAALAEPLFARCVATAKRGCAVTDAEGRARNVVWRNTNRLLDTEGYDGVKTGSTSAAGLCLVAAGRRGDDRLIVVVLGSGSSDARYAHARNLFRWGWVERGHKRP